MKNAVVICLALCLALPALAQSNDTLARFKYVEAEKALKAGNHALCIDELKGARQLLGRVVQRIQVRLVECLFKAGRHDEVVEEAKKYFALNPDEQLVEFQEVGAWLVSSQREVDRLKAERERRRIEAEQRRIAAERAEQERIDRERRERIERDKRDRERRERLEHERLERLEREERQRREHIAGAPGRRARYLAEAADERGRGAGQMSLAVLSGVGGVGCIALAAVSGWFVFSPSDLDPLLYPVGGVVAGAGIFGAWWFFAEAMPDASDSSKWAYQRADELERKAEAEANLIRSSGGVLEE